LQMVPLDHPFLWRISQEATLLGASLLTLFPIVQVLFSVLVTQLTVSLHAGSLVSCHKFLSLFLCFNRWSMPGNSISDAKL
jgi:hypothetical protein